MIRVKQLFYLILFTICFLCIGFQIEAGSTKTKIIERVNEPINRLVKYKFQKMFLEDKLYTALPNVDSWLLTNFNQLNHYAEKSHI